jgi:hypothetical protein
VHSSRVASSYNPAWFSCARSEAMTASGTRTGSPPNQHQCAHPARRADRSPVLVDSVEPDEQVTGEEGLNGLNRPPPDGGPDRSVSGDSTCSPGVEDDQTHALPLGAYKKKRHTSPSWIVRDRPARRTRPHLGARLKHLTSPERSVKIPLGPPFSQRGSSVVPRGYREITADFTSVGRILVRPSGKSSGRKTTHRTVSSFVNAITNARFPSLRFLFPTLRDPFRDGRVSIEEWVGNLLLQCLLGSLVVGFGSVSERRRACAGSGLDLCLIPARCPKRSVREVTCYSAPAHSSRSGLAITATVA